MKLVLGMPQRVLEELGDFARSLGAVHEYVNPFGVATLVFDNDGVETNKTAVLEDGEWVLVEDCIPSFE